MTINSNSNLETIQSINLATLTPTLICFTLGLIYYYYKFRNTRENLVANGNYSASNNDNSNANGNLNNNIGNNSNTNNLNADLTKIFIIINNERNEFFINKNQIIRDFIRNTLYEIVRIDNNKKIFLICQGRRLEESHTFSEYSAISNNTVMHCFVTTNNSYNSNISNNNTSNSLFESSAGSATSASSNLQHDENAVSIYTIVTHCIILSFILVFLYLHKTVSDLLTKGALIIFQLLIIVWITQVSKCLVKLVIYGKILYA